MYTLAYCAQPTLPAVHRCHHSNQLFLLLLHLSATFLLTTVRLTAIFFSPPSFLLLLRSPLPTLCYCYANIILYQAVVLCCCCYFCSGVRYCITFADIAVCRSLQWWNIWLLSKSNGDCCCSKVQYLLLFLKYSIIYLCSTILALLFLFLFVETSQVILTYFELVNVFCTELPFQFV